MKYNSMSTEELVCACAESGNAEAWQEFVCRFGKLIHLVIRRVARRYQEKNPCVIEDLVQETYAKICNSNCRLLREFDPHHTDAFFGMLKVTAGNVARDYYRARNSSKRGSGKSEIELDETSTVFQGTHSSHTNRIEQRILLQEIDRILNVVVSTKRDREIFWLHYKDGFTSSEIAKIPSYGLTTKGVESILHRVKCELRTKLAEPATVLDGRHSESEGIQGRKPLFKGEEQP